MSDKRVEEWAALTLDAAPNERSRRMRAEWLALLEPEERERYARMYLASERAKARIRRGEMPYQLAEQKRLGAAADPARERRGRLRHARVHE